MDTTGSVKAAAGHRFMGLAEILAAAFAGLVILMMFHELRHDDAYITLRYAQNLALGRGYAFNPGELVLGATSPLTTWLLALLHPFVGARLPETAIAIGAASVAAQAWILFQVLRPGFPVTAFVTSIAVALGGFGAYNWLALDTNLFAALVLGTLYAFSRGARAWTGVLLAASFLCRYEGALLIPVLGAWSLLARRRLPTRELLVAGVIVSPWLLFATLYFGSPLPNTLDAKLGWTHPVDYLRTSLRQMTLIPGLPVPDFKFTIGIISMLAGIILTRRRCPTLLAAGAFAACLLLGYAAIGPPINQRWHVYIPRLVIQLFALTGVLVALELGLRGFGRWCSQAVTAAVGIAFLAVLANNAAAFHAGFEKGLWLGERQRRYEAVVDWMSRELRPGRSMLAEEVGTLGFLSDFRMIDPYGLVQSHVTEETHPDKSGFGSFGLLGRGHSAILPLIRTERPEVVLVDDGKLRCWLDKNESYTVVMVFDWENDDVSSEAPHKWSTLAVRGREVLRNPGRLEALAAAARHVGLPCADDGEPGNAKSERG